MALFFSGWESFQTAGQFAAGRGEFLAKKYETAIGHFEKVAKAVPGYVFVCVGFRESVWTYLGRCQYRLGNFPDAHYSLERALAINGEDHLARVFMGLTRVRLGDDADGFRELERGLKGLHEWIEYENVRDPSKSFWDPAREIRNEIATSLGRISEKKFERQKLIEDAEWIGQKMEDEIDQVRRQESRLDE